MKVTVCEMNDDPQAFERDWARLSEHVRTHSSDLVLLPEMPFYSWFANKPDYDPQAWNAAVEAHEHWLERLNALAPAVVLGTRPVNAGGRRINEGFVWDTANGYRAAHTKYYLPDDEGFWEASWYERGDGRFEPVQAGDALVGFAICTELWFMQRARDYGQAGVHLLVTPRATGFETVEKWLTGGRAAAVISGAFSLSSNRAGLAGGTATFGGQGWIISPDGDVMALTSPDHPFVTREIDLQRAEAAKQTYPRYVQE